MANELFVKGGRGVAGRIAAGQRCVVMAFVPSWGEIFCANCGLMERLHLSVVVVVISPCDGQVVAVDGLGVSNAELCQASGTISCEFSKVHIKRAIFLEHEEDVLDHSGRRSAHCYRCRLRDIATVTYGCGRRVSRSGRRSDGGRSLWCSARTTNGLAGTVDNGERGWWTSCDLPTQCCVLARGDVAGRRAETQRNWNRDSNGCRAGSPAGSCRRERKSCRLARTD